MRATALAAACLCTFALLAAPANAADGVRLEVQQARVAGTTIAYADLGDGPTLVLLNGTASPMNEWDPALLGALAENHHVIVLDYPGLGLSGPAPARWTFPRGADWIAEFLSAVAPDEAVDVLGWSMGGFIAQQLAQRHPEHVRRLVLAATNPGGEATVLGPDWVQQADSDGDLHDYLLTNYPRGRRAAGQRFLDRLDAAISSGAYPRETVPARTARAMVRAEDPWLRSDANIAGLPGVSAPTLVITGADDVITPLINSRRIARAIPDARLVLVPDSGHSFLFQQPRRTARTVHAFLTEDLPAIPRS